MTRGAAGPTTGRDEREARQHRAVEERGQSERGSSTAVPAPPKPDPLSSSPTHPPTHPTPPTNLTGDGSTAHLDGAPASHAPPFPAPPPGTGADVGRSPPADILLPLPTVSARHGRVEVAEGAATVTVFDFGSTNGTYVDGEAIEADSATVVPLGSTVVFGDQYLAAFRLEDV